LPGVVFGLGEPGFEQLLEQDRDFLSVGRAERVELERMLADRQLVLLARARGRAVDPGELAAVRGIVVPDLGRGVDVGHPDAPAEWRGGNGVSVTEPQAGARRSAPYMASALEYVDDRGPGITRKKASHGWAYYAPDGKRIADRDEIDRLNRIALPPANTDAWFCPSGSGHLLATGMDARGRRQYRYNPEFRLDQA